MNNIRLLTPAKTTCGVAATHRDKENLQDRKNFEFVKNK